MASPAWFSFQGILDLVLGNIGILLPIGAVIFFAIGYLRIKSKVNIKPINRADIERQAFLDRMIHNENKTSHFKTLKRGKHAIGKITHYTEAQIKGNPHNRTIAKMVLKPLRTPLQIPFGRSSCFIIDKDILINRQDSKGQGYIQVPASTHFDAEFGIYYNKEHELTNRVAIINDGVLKQDLNNLASVYFAKSQQQATFDPEHAHQLAMREKEIQLEMSKKRGQLTSI